MITKINLEIEATNEAEAKKAEESIKLALSKFKARGMIKLMETYQSNIMVKMAINKELGIK